MNLTKEINVLKRNSHGKGFDNSSTENWKPYGSDVYHSNFSLDYLAEIKKELINMGNDQDSVNALLVATMKSRNSSLFHQKDEREKKRESKSTQETIPDYRYSF